MLKKKNLLKTLLATVLVAAFVLSPLANVVADASTEGTMDVGVYKGDKTQDEWTYPTEPGKIFAGWFTDTTYTTAYTGTTGNAYAKFVDANVLTVKRQLSTVTDNNIRFLTAINTVYLEKVVFDVDIPTQDKYYELEEKSAYTSVIADGSTITDAATVFGTEDANLFVVHTITGAPASAFDSDITVTPYWYTLDGTKVTGTQRVFTLNEAKMSVAEGAVTKAAGATEAEVIYDDLALKAGQQVTFDLTVATSVRTCIYVYVDGVQLDAVIDMGDLAAGTTYPVTVEIPASITSASQLKLWVRFGHPVKDFADTRERVFKITNLKVPVPGAVVKPAGQTTVDVTYDVAMKAGQTVSFDFAILSDVTPTFEDRAIIYVYVDRNAISSLNPTEVWYPKAKPNTVSFVVPAEISSASQLMVRVGYGHGTPGFCTTDEFEFSITNITVSDPKEVKPAGQTTVDVTYDVAMQAGQTVSFDFTLLTDITQTTQTLYGNVTTIWGYVDGVAVPGEYTQLADAYTTGTQTVSFTVPDSVASGSKLKLMVCFGHALPQFCITDEVTFKITNITVQ